MHQIFTNKKLEQSLDTCVYQGAYWKFHIKIMNLFWEISMDLVGVIMFLVNAIFTEQLQATAIIENVHSFPARNVLIY